MMRKIESKKLYIVVCLLASLLAGCKNKANKEAYVPISFDTLFVAKDYPLVAGKSDPKMEVNVMYLSPQNNEKMSQAMLKEVFGGNVAGMQPKDAINTYIENLLENYKTSNDSLSDGDLPYELLNYQYEISNNIVYQDSSIISCIATKYSYEGGAHGGQELNQFTYFKKNVVKINERDLFVDGYNDALAKIIVNKLVEDYHKKTPDDLFSEGFMDPAEIQPNGNFYLDSQYIVYCFNEYEIAAYALGPIKVKVPYQSLVGILKEDSPINRFLK
ncbi:DUF3298 and DUF4163 domain-containing protein [Porphyromonas pogonae]|uniref:DUF3298 and DUF4163 domain-containing protein n=1 Tax=Porphyromonas pogonae TaxID=867595 RepID=UPI002E75D851|nr:DUF3298 domain-containing protein [Porphyromonas pogonae]